MRIKNITAFKKLKRVIAFALLLCVVSVFLLSMGHMLEHALHDHDGHDGAVEECSVCVHIEHAVKVMTRFAVAIFTALLAVMALIAGISPVKSVLNTGFSTPVSLKLRMNN